MLYRRIDSRFTAVRLRVTVLCSYSIWMQDPSTLHSNTIHLNFVGIFSKQPRAKYHTQTILVKLGVLSLRHVYRVIKTNELRIEAEG